ncbi:hypothetical protein ABEB36_004562 [Hypothenemus hampei]|uniref:Uncharacterized protein n=1 Tax=Hypothenemus hampei TaxID=57062 RepID=A0ABD1F3S5_HYPHA
MVPLKALNLFLYYLLFVIWINKVHSIPTDYYPPSTTTEAPNTWDKIKKGVEHGWRVVYDESHCAFHKVKELVNPHDHPQGSDPCTNKPYQQKSSTTTPKSLIGKTHSVIL